MTEKELLYYEDALMHEINTISICNDMIKNIKDEELVTFIKDEVSKHNKIKEKLLKKLEEKVNE